MADTTFATGNASTVKLWSKKLFREVKKQTWFDKFIGTGSSSLIQICPETSKSAGDKVTTTLRMQLSGDGISGDSTLEGNEEALSTYTDAVLLDQLRHAVRSAGRMSDQRIAFSVREEAMQGLADWWSTRIDVALMNQLSGNTDVADTKLTGGNATVAPDANHWVYGGTHTTEATLVAGDEMTLDVIDKCREKSAVLSPAIRPVKVNGEDYYVMFLHPYQVYDLRTNTSSGQWLDIQKAAMQGGMTTKNPIFTGALGVYNKVILHESANVPDGASQVDVRRAIFCGAQAGMIAYGQEDRSGSIGVRKRTDNHMTWVEEQFDYGNKLGVSAGMIFGAKKSIFNSADFATIVASTYAVAH